MVSIVDTLILQHRTLQKDLSDVAGGVQHKKIEDILQNLRKFDSDVHEHLNLESIYYVELLKKMKEHGVDTQKTEQFIGEINIIGNSVVSFLKKYSDVSSINDNFSAFDQELQEIIVVLNLRIQSEEAGVYSYWGLYK